MPAELRCVGAMVPLRISKSTGVSALLRRREWKTRGVMGAMDEVIGLAAAHLELFVMGTTPSPRRLRAEAFRRSQPRSHLRLALPREMAQAGAACCSNPNICIHAPPRCPRIAPQPPNGSPSYSAHVAQRRATTTKSASPPPDLDAPATSAAGPRPKYRASRSRISTSSARRRSGVHVMDSSP